MKYIKDINGKLKELESDINEIRKFPLKNFPKQSFIPILKSAFTKSFDYCLALKKASRSDSFIYLPFLRGICEDIICLKYISKSLKEPLDRDEIALKYALYLQHSSIQAQQAFFEQVGSYQLSLTQPAELVLNLENDLKKFWGNHGHNPNKIFPGVQHMAIDASLSVLYDFLYHATSKMVHFSPNILLRLGWYKEETEQNDIIFSISNFGQYYHSFNNFYGPYLFVLFAEQFRKELGLSKTFMKKIRDIKAILIKLEFYPELVTYEEMNLKRPSDFIEFTHKFFKKLEEKRAKANKSSQKTRQK